MSMFSFKHFILILIFFLLTDQSVMAARSSYSVDRSDLDDDIVEIFPVPVLFGVDKNVLVPDFGDSRGGGTRSHEGQDMRAPLGTPIVSPTEAIVISTGFGDSAGNYVYTANPGGETFRYMHLDTIADIKRGDKLDIGDFIGTVGDTGNAPDGIYHLHLEVRDDKNTPTDPYERFDDESFSLKQKMSFLRDIIRDVEDEDEYADFLVKTFSSDFMVAVEKKYSLPDVIEDALDDSGANDKVRLLAKLDTLIRSIPSIVSAGLREGDSGAGVSLMQTYIIYTNKGSARDALAATGATGYYGRITAAAISEYQEQNKLSVTGIYDTETKTRMAILESKYPF